MWQKQNRVPSVISWRHKGLAFWGGGLSLLVVSSENVKKMGNHSWGIHGLILFALFLPPEMICALTPGIFYSDVEEFIVYWVRSGAATRPPTVVPCWFTWQPFWWEKVRHLKAQGTLGMLCFSRRWLASCNSSATTGMESTSLVRGQDWERQGQGHCKEDQAGYTETDVSFLCVAELQGSHLAAWSHLGTGVVGGR